MIRWRSEVLRLHIVEEFPELLDFGLLFGVLDLHSCILDHFRGGEERCPGPNRESDRIGWAGGYVNLLSIPLENEIGVKDGVAQFGDHDSRDGAAQRLGNQLE